MSDNPGREEALARHGIEVVERVPLPVPPCESTIASSRTKRERPHHRLPHWDAVAHWS